MSFEQMITVKRTNSDNKDFQRLVHELDKDLAIRNGEANVFFAQYNQLDTIKNVVVVYNKEQAVGCGAMKQYDAHTMEIKRMFVPFENRGKGFATLVLQELENWTSELGYHKCILETGDKMPEAISLYHKCGFKVIPNYGQYEHISSSICFEKAL